MKMTREEVRAELEKIYNFREFKDNVKEEAMDEYIKALDDPEELAKLVCRGIVFGALECGGVDNWDWYGDSVSEIFISDDEDEGDDEE